MTTASTSTDTDTLDTPAEEGTFSARLSSLDVANAIADLYAASTGKTQPTMYEYASKPDDKGNVQVRFLDGGREYLMEALEWAKSTKEQTVIAFPNMNQPAWYAARKVSWLV